MRYLVTGATGFIGGRVARQLAAAGHEVRALVRDPDRAADLAGLGITLHRGDITDAGSLRAPCAGRTWTTPRLPTCWRWSGDGRGRATSSVDLPIP